MALGWRKEYARYTEYFLNILALYKQRADLRAFLEIILSLSTVIIFTLFALKPTVLTIISLLNEIKEKKVVVAALDQKIANLTTAQRVYDQNSAQIADIDNALSTLPKPNTFTNQVEGLASKDSAKILGLSVGEVTLFGTDPQQRKPVGSKPLPSGAREMPISLSVSGNYPTLLNFIKDFENLRVPSKIDILSINSSATDVGQVIVAIISGRVPFIGNE